MEETLRPLQRRKSYGKWLLAILLAGLMSREALAVDENYINTAFYLSGSGAPAINATNFINDYSGTFDIEFTNVTASGWLSGLYQNWSYVRNFYNYNLMQCNTGFRFDKLIGAQHLMADSFYNEGNINCGISPNNNLLASGLFGIYVYATNIFNSGTITIGPNGLGRFSGRNMDFTRGTIQLTNTTGFNANPILGTNYGDWLPAFDLTPTSAQSAFLNAQPFFLTLTNSRAYFNVRPSDLTGTNLTVRMMFIQNINTNVAYNVYFDSNNVVGIGRAHVEWFAPYYNILNGQNATNYLYLSDDYVLGASTNVFQVPQPANNLPINYTFTATQTQQLFSNAPTVASFPNFPLAIPFTPASNNIFSYVNAQFIRTSIDTNQVQNSAITNLPGRIEIIATNSLNLALSTLTGMNYLLLRSTNQFSNAGDSQILSPYMDMYLGATNSNLVISNVLAGEVPTWSGNVQAWNTRWFASDAVNSYDFRVLLVNADLNPTNASVVQDCVLYSSNNLVISDVLNIIRTLSLNCTNLTITTNNVGTGAANQRGQILLNSSSLFWSNCVPRLRVLTNNGAIVSQNLANYGGITSPYYTLLNSGFISHGNGVFIYANDFENSGYFSAGGGSFSIRSQATKMTNGTVIAAGSFTNVSGTFEATNSLILIGKSFNLVATNLLTDYGATSNFWSLGSANGGAGIASGIFLPIKPVAGDLLGTTISNIATAGTLINNTWSGQDRGAVNAGFSNNVAIGQLMCDAKGANPHTQFYFAGNGLVPTNAIYVDNLVLQEYATNVDADYNVKSLVFCTNKVSNVAVSNLVIYYAQAMINGVSVAEKLNHKNGDHLRWIPTYAGYFSSTNLVYPPGVTNTVNAALAQSSSIDSDGDGIVNSVDATPFFVTALLNFTIAKTNSTPKGVRLEWQTIPNGTNYIFYSTNLLDPWQPFTNFGKFYYGNNVGVTNYPHSNFFPSPLVLPTNPPINDLRTNVWVFDVITNTPHFYRVMVQPWLTYPY